MTDSQNQPDSNDASESEAWNWYFGDPDASETPVCSYEQNDAEAPASQEVRTWAATERWRLIVDGYTRGPWTGTLRQLSLERHFELLTAGHATEVEFLTYEARSL